MSNKSKTTPQQSDGKPALTPKLRFPEFRDAEGWREGRIADIAKVLQGYGFPERYQGQTTGEYPFYKVSDISNTLAAGRVFIDESANYITGDVLKELKAKPIPEGTTIFAKIGEAIRSNRRAITTKSCLIDNNAAGVKRIKGKSTDLFVYFTMETISLIDYSGGVVPAVNKSAIENLAVKFPAIEEQQKIAECLSSVDELIAAQARKLDALKTHKKGLMQQLFPREGETQPRLRFPEFQNAGEWECKTLKDIAEIRSGTTPLRSNPEFFSEGSIPWVKTTDLNNSFIIETEEKITPKARARVNPAGSVLVAMYGGFNQIGRTGCLSVPAATNQAISVLVLDREVVLPVYVLAWLNAKVENWKRIASSSRKDPNVTGSDVAKFPITLPETQEQQRIADCLTSLDDLIAAQTQKLDALKTHKKGLMQQLFPSPEEVEAWAA